MFPGNVYLPNVVARYCVMFLRVQKKLKEHGLTELFQILVYSATRLTVANQQTFYKLANQDTRI